MRQHTLCLAALLLCSFNTAQELLEQCEDVAGARHQLGDSYIGTDGCNRCKCLESGSACTKRLCPAASEAEAERRRSRAEAGKCVDNLGVLHEVGQQYTHVDGCNSCTCTEAGGACTRRFCLPQPRSCEDPRGVARSKEEDGAWLDTDGCNTCLCGPLGAVCTEKFCGEHRGWTDEANNAEVEEISHNQVAEEGDIPCRDAVTNQDRMPGDSWLSEDSCNICTCTGTGGRPVCTEMGCRARLARQLAGSAAAAAATISTVLSVVAAAILVTAL